MNAAAPHPNRARLEGFVAACLDRAAACAPAERPAWLRRNARHVESQLRALSAWAAEATAHPAPPHLQGLSVFDLSDAMDRLDAAAVRAGHHLVRP